MERINQIEAMKLFIEVVERGGFSAAARNLRIQQSTVSRIISQLETEYNTTLLTRSTRNMVLTEAGHLLLGESRKLISEIDEIKSKLKQTQDEPRGLLRLSLPITFGRLFVVPTLVDFKSKFPQINLEVHFEDRLVDLVSDGYDVVIRVGASEDSFVTNRKLAIVRRGMYVSKNLIKKIGPIRSPQDLEKYPAILFEDRMPKNPKWNLSQGKSKKSVHIHSATCVNQLDSLCDLVCAGLGVGYVPQFLANDNNRFNHIERILPDWDVIGDIDRISGVYALFHGGSKVSAKVRAFVDHLIEHLRHLPN